MDNQHVVLRSDGTVACDPRNEHPVQRVLRLPELLPEIFQHLDRKSLYAALRVNRAWAAAAIPILWRRPTRKALGAVPARRCAAYDAAVRRVELRVMLQQPLPKKAWRLPRLQSLTLVYREPAAERQKLQAALQRYAATLTHVAIISYRRSGGGGSSGGGGGGGGDGGDGGGDGAAFDVTDPRWCCVLGSSGDLLLAALAACRRLVRLQLDLEITAAAMRAFVRLQQGPEHPHFPQLRALRARVAAAALPSLCPVIGRVQELALGVVDGYQANGRILSALSSHLPRLRKLELATDDVILGEELEHLAGLSELEILCIWRRGPVFSTDEALASVLSRLGRLRILLLPASSGLSDAAYALAGRYCPQLTELELNAKCDVRHFRHFVASGRPLFPLLQTLSINQFKGVRKLQLRHLETNPLTNSCWTHWCSKLAAKDSPVDDFRRAFPLAKLFRQEAPMLRVLAVAQRKIRRVWRDIVKIMPLLPANNNNNNNKNNNKKRKAGSARGKEARPSKRQKVAH